MKPPIIPNSKFQINTHNMSLYLLSKGYIPGLKSSFHRAVLKYCKGQIPPHYTWVMLSKRGRKGLISDDGIVELINKFKMEFTGGQSCPKSYLREWVIRKIKSEWNNRHKDLNRDQPKIHESTIGVYVDIIASHKFVNIVTNVPRKTENRLAAEWSQRSTINFMMAVAVVHFFSATPSPLHPSKKSSKTCFRV